MLSFSAKDTSQEPAICPSWVKGPLTERYFITEWGQVPLVQEVLFEHLCLLVFQTGLSWETVLKYRAGLSELFFTYNLSRISQETDEYFAKALANNTSIIRNRQKIDACRHNARCLLEHHIDLATLLIEEYPLPRNIEGSYEDLPHVTERTKVIASHLKGVGLIYIGPTTIGSLVQATGLVRLTQAHHAKHNQPIHN